MQTQITWKTSPNNRRLHAHVEYGVFDSKGRQLGHHLIIDTQGHLGWKRDEAGNIVLHNSMSVSIKGITAKSQSTRDGITFGASFPKEYPMGSIEQAKDFMLQQVLKFEKQIKAKAEKNGGIYK